MQNVASEILCEIFETQLIDYTQTLLSIPNLCEIFKYDSVEMNHVRNETCFKTQKGDDILNRGNYLKRVSTNHFAPCRNR